MRRDDLAVAGLCVVCCMRVIWCGLDGVRLLGAPYPNRFGAHLQVGGDGRPLEGGTAHQQVPLCARRCDGCPRRQEAAHPVPQLEAHNRAPGLAGCVALSPCRVGPTGCRSGPLVPMLSRRRQHTMVNCDNSDVRCSWHRPLSWLSLQVAMRRCSCLLL